jgi:Pyruvate/2-oxoacid:ferredoxin oxidoreductase delta subunit
LVFSLLCKECYVSCAEKGIELQEKQDRMSLTNKQIAGCRVLPEKLTGS